MIDLGLDRIGLGHRTLKSAYGWYFLGDPMHPRKEHYERPNLIPLPPDWLGKRIDVVHRALRASLSHAGAFALSLTVPEWNSISSIAAPLDCFPPSYYATMLEVCLATLYQRRKSVMHLLPTQSRHLRNEESCHAVYLRSPAARNKNLGQRISQT